MGCEYSSGYPHWSDFNASAHRSSSSSYRMHRFNLTALVVASVASTMAVSAAAEPEFGKKRSATPERFQNDWRKKKPGHR